MSRDQDVANDIAAMRLDILGLRDATEGAALKNYELELSKGNIEGHSIMQKFGKAVGIDTADGFVDIWDGSDDANAAKTYTFSTSADIDRLSSSAAGDTQVIEVQGLDADWRLTIQHVPLNGITPVVIPTSLIRVFRMKNLGSTNNAGIIYCFVNGADTNGVPDTNADIRAEIIIGLNQTLMAIYTIPDGKTAYMTDFWAALEIKIATASVIHLEMREAGSVFRIQHATNVNSTGSSHMQHAFLHPIAIPARTDVRIQADSSQNASAVSAGFDLVLSDNGGF